MVTTVLGKVAVTPKGEWNGTTAYEKLDVVSYGGSSYLSVRDVPSGTSLSNTNYWMLLAQKGDTGNAIASIEKTATSGLTDTYTITFTNGNTTTFTVTNGEAATVIVGTVTTGAEGTAVVITNSGDDHDAVLNFTIPRGNTGNGIQGIELTGTSGGVKTYTITFTDGETFSFDVTDGEVTETRLAEALEDYALTDGYYEDLVAGGSEQLLSSVYEEDNEPYLFRTSGGTMDIGDREEDTIVGGTIAWNQYAKVFSANNWVSAGSGSSVSFENGVATLTVGASYNRVIMTPPISKNAHKILVSVDINPNIEGTFMFGLWSSDSSNTSVARAVAPSLTQNVWQTVSTIGILTDGNDNKLAAQYNSGTGTAQLKNPIAIDLTQMFGSAIADYIYSLETATAGAGVAWFKKMFPKPYYEYNTGELLSVEGLQSHDMVGFNAWDGTYTANATINSTDGEMASQGATATWVATGYIPIIPSQTYYFNVYSTNGATIRGMAWYDADKNYISGTSAPGASVYGEITAPSNAHFVRCSVETARINETCINLSWDGERDGEYEPYKKHSYPLDDSITLRGIPKLDSNNKLYYDGDLYEADGTVTRKYGIVDLSSKTWTYQSNWASWYTDYISDMRGTDTGAETPKFICNKYDTIATNYGLTPTNFNGITSTTRGANGCRILVRNGSTTVAPTGYLVYELATPTTEEAEPFISPQIVDDFGTEEYVTDSIVPVGHVTKYMPNLKAKLEMAPDSPSDNGDYIVRHTNGRNEYVPLVIPTELPTAPSEDGTYHLKLTVANGTATLAWEAE